MKKKIDAHIIATMGLLIGLMVVLSQVLGFETQLLKITFDFVPEVVMASLFGPWWTAIGASIADIIGNTLLGKAPFFIGFTLNSFIAGLLYGYFFYKKPITIKNSLQYINYQFVSDTNLVVNDVCNSFDRYETLGNTYCQSGDHATCTNSHDRILWSCDSFETLRS